MVHAWRRLQRRQRIPHQNRSRPRVEEVAAPTKRRASRSAPTAVPPLEEDATYEVYEPTADEEAEMFDYDELPPDENT